MPLRKRGPEEEKSTGLLKKKGEDRKKQRSDRAESRRAFRLEKIAAIRDKFYAVAAKRKWLVFMIVAAIAAYLIIFKGGFSFGG